MHLSVVSPVYRGENSVEELVAEVQRHVKGITEDFEIILVEDCGPDKSWEKIQAICERNPNVVGIRLSRNFGQHYAISAGLDHSSGEWVVVMDCDLQDRPDQIPVLYAKAMEGFDVVQGRREERKDSLLKKASSRLFYRCLAYLSGYRQDSTIANFGVYSRKVVDTICSMRESIRFFPTMVAWVGFSKTSIRIEHALRAEGKSSYSFSKLFNLALDIILAYSDKPLRLMVKLGLITSLISFLFLIYNAFKYFSGQIIVLGYASLILSIWFLSGVLMLMLGVVGLYVGKTFQSTKGRPIYIVDQKVNGQIKT